MHEYRGILAAVCAGVGLLLLVVSIWKSSAGNRKAGRLTWLYTALFFIVSIVLWHRDSAPSSDPTAIIEPRDKTIPHQTQDSKSIDSVATVPSPTKSGEHVADRGSIKTEEMRVLPKLDQVAERDRQVSGSERVQPVVSETVGRLQDPKAVAKKSAPEPAAGDWTQAVDFEPAEVQDKIYSAIDGAFVWVTRFFEKHGSPASSPAVAQRPVPAQVREPKREPLHFPSVNFYLGTAELTGTSLTSLRELAANLQEREDLGVLEIQARVDSLGPEAFNFILTEARAATVRDYLISEGVPASQIVARGLGSSVLDAPKENSEVQFVVRR